MIIDTRGKINGRVMRKTFIQDNKLINSNFITL